VKPCYSSLYPSKQRNTISIKQSITSNKDNIIKKDPKKTPKTNTKVKAPLKRNTISAESHKTDKAKEEKPEEENPDDEINPDDTQTNKNQDEAQTNRVDEIDNNNKQNLPCF